MARLDLSPASPITMAEAYAIAGLARTPANGAAYRPDRNDSGLSAPSFRLLDRNGVEMHRHRPNLRSLGEGWRLARALIRLRGL